MSSADKEVTDVAQIYRMDSGNAREAFDKFADTQEKNEKSIKKQTPKIGTKRFACMQDHACMFTSVHVYLGGFVCIYIYMQLGICIMHA